ncbi:hypothetical protein [uncultured Parabacteroides sp.]|uniref:hypothetical protein n=1 Tax=uncultured Parabacteroides sp. TaxID=512312 RepID=UPI00262AEE8C|nr:hypothetical protein [uncultured Parabacteroides sp.]
MSEAELRLVKVTGNCTIYSIQFLSEDESEFERFYAKFRDESVYNEDFERLLNIIGRIADFGAFERFFRPEGKMSDRVCALPVLKSRLRLYCLRLSDKILILGNGGVKNTRTYNENDMLKGYVITLQNFDKLITEGVKNGSILVKENTIETENTFDI